MVRCRYGGAGGWYGYYSARAVLSASGSARGISSTSGPIRQRARRSALCGQVQLRRALYTGRRRDLAPQRGALRALGAGCRALLVVRCGRWLPGGLTLRGTSKVHAPVVAPRRCWLLISWCVLLGAVTEGGCREDIPYGEPLKSTPTVAVSPLVPRFHAPLVLFDCWHWLIFIRFCIGCRGDLALQLRGDGGLGSRC